MTAYPLLRYRDARAALDFLQRAFAFEPLSVHGDGNGRIAHAEIRAGAEITMEPTDQDYGSRDFAARDLEGNEWSFGTYVPQPVSAAP